MYLLKIDLPSLVFLAIVLSTAIVACSEDNSTTDMTTKDTTSIDSTDNSNKTKMEPRIETIHILGPNTGPDDVTFDSNGNLYISNYGGWTGSQGNGTQIFQINTDGHESVFLEGLNDPLGSVFNSQGDFFVVYGDNSDSVYYLARKSKNEDVNLTYATLSYGAAALTIDDNDNLYVGYGLAGIARIDKIDPLGKLTTFREHENFAVCVDIEYHNGVFYFSTNSQDFTTQGSVNGTLYSMEMSGKIKELATITGSISNIAKLGDDIYFAGYSSHQIYRYSLTTQKHEPLLDNTRGMVDGNTTEASVTSPNGMSADEINKVVYFTEYDNRSIRKIVFD